MPASVLVTPVIAPVDGVDARSKAPMSQLDPCGRLTPRWSTTEQPSTKPALSAGLPVRRARVSVGPPLSAREPRFASVTNRLAGQLVFPDSVIVPPRFVNVAGPVIWAP